MFFQNFWNLTEHFIQFHVWEKSLVKECSAVFNQQMMGYNDSKRPNMEKVNVLPL